MFVGFLLAYFCGCSAKGNDAEVNTQDGIATFGDMDQNKPNVFTSEKDALAAQNQGNISPDASASGSLPNGSK